MEIMVIMQQIKRCNSIEVMETKKNFTGEDIIFLGESNFRNEEKRLGIKTDDRRRHIYAVGKTGMGKTAFLKNMIIQDIKAGRGIGFLDPHGEAAEDILNFVPKERIKDVVYFNPADLDHPIAFNVMEEVGEEYRHLVASGLMSVFKKIWPDVWSARMEYILHNSVLALLECPGTSLLGINRMLSDPKYREEIVSQIKDPVVKAFWVQEFARYTERYEVEATAAIQNKIGQFISTPLIRNIVGQDHSTIDMRDIMDTGKILIINLSKGRIGEDASKLLGGLLITKLQLAAMSRVDIFEEDRKDFFLYVDEFQNFATESFTNILSEARKYRLDLILAHQYISQMEETVRDAVFGNIGTLVCFRVGADDAEFLEKEFLPDFNASDLVNLPKYHIYLKLMVDGVATRPFSARTLPPFETPEESFRQEIIDFSRQTYSTSRDEIEKKIAEWTGDYVLQSKKEKPKLYDAVCDRCGKPIKVPFKPEPGKPVYCKSCLKEIMEEKKNKNQEGTVNIDEGEKIKTFSLSDLFLKKPVSFFKKKENEPEKKEKKKKEVNKEELRTLLEESLPKDEETIKKEEEEKEEEKEEKPIKKDNISEDRPKVKKKGKIEPGETVKF